MNDGIGRISRSLLRKVHSRLDQGSDYPLCGFQGRIGSAKGFWILDVDEDDNGDDWIELYESQRKWECDLEDPLHRTIEVRNTPHKLKSALLNLQFLPILYDRARDKAAFREYMKILLTKNLESELDVHMTAMDSAEQLRQWASTFGFRQDLAASMLGGLPDSDEDTLAFLLDAGVDKDYQLIKDISWRLRKSKCDTLLSTLKIRVPRSAYMYMTVDFQGVLEEDEVHIGFSSRFVTEDAEFSAKLLRGIDVLVARAPAHLPSDVQRVRAVFKTELNDLEDVIVFSSKGSVPLASKLSGGDYDGDQAWVCWDPEIVQNFDNFPMPTMPDLFKEGYMRKETRKFCDLQASGTGSFDGVESLDEVCRTWISESIQFNLQPNFLGMATNYKERFCYAHGHNSVSGPAAIKLSTLLSNLVDQPKQGILFSEADFSRLKAGIGARTWYHDPAYKGDKWTRPDTEPDHIIDYIKFKVAKPMIESVLKRFHEYMNEGSKTGAPSRLYWDQDLAALYDTFKAISKQSKSVEKLAQRLEHDLERVFMLWNAKMQPVKDGMARRSPSEYQQAVWDVFNEWWAVAPRNEGAGFKTAALLLLPTVVAAALPHHSVDVGDGPPSPYSTWALLRASATFKLFYARNPRFVWRIAGMQLLYLKAQAQVGHAMAMGAGAQGESGPAAAAAIVPVVPRMYSILRPDARAVRRLVSERDGRVSVFDDEAGVVAVAYQQAGRPEQLQRQIADGVTSIGAAAGFDGASDDGTAASEYLDYYDAYSVILMDDDAVYDDVD